MREFNTPISIDQLSNSREKLFLLLLVKPGCSAEAMEAESHSKSTFLKPLFQATSELLELWKYPKAQQGTLNKFWYSQQTP